MRSSSSGSGKRMTVEVAQRRTRKPKARPVQESLAIGEIDQTVFACPACARPLALGARRCPGCGTRLVLGVKAQRASIFASAGLVAGLVLSGMFGAATSALDSARRDADAAAIAAAAANASPATTPTPTPTTSPTTSARPGTTSSVPALTRSALGQAVAVNGRLASSAEALAAALAAPTFDTFAASQVLRSTSADAVFGLQLTRHIGEWSGGKALSGELTAFYAAVQETAAEGLSASIRNDKAYQAAAQSMLDLLGDLDEVNEQVRDVAEAADIALVAVP